MSILVWLINAMVQLAVVAVIAYVLLSFLFDNYHPLRRALGRLIDPLLAPIRRVVPLIGNMDISPIILILIFEILGRIVVMMVYALFK